jgi:phosphohistidine phosphatase
MAAQGYAPSLVLCSTARRTRETYELVRPYLAGSPKVEYRRALYLAGVPQLLAAVEAVGPAYESLLLIGHNPGMEQLAQQLARAPQNTAERKHLQALTQKFPTGALAVFSFEGHDWAHIGQALGALIDFARPRDLGPAP